ncbi:MAG: helix-turn-helix domain-containing protein [Magnetococcus sp. DMHC-1]|nr:helix-turn-helix transcriptional regulator [Magnetococcales bacterium]MBF0154096.1 helix-turn-helix transcriptional regulator [Magnetococcales bacterium]
MKETFGRRLREAREKIGCSQRGLGVKIGLPPKKASVYVNRWERQGKQPNWETIDKMAEALHVPPAFFLAEDDALAEIILLVGKMPLAERITLAASLITTSSNN